MSDNQHSKDDDRKIYDLTVDLLMDLLKLPASVLSGPSDILQYSDFGDTTMLPQLPVFDSVSKILSEIREASDDDELFEESNQSVPVPAPASSTASPVGPMTRARTRAQQLANVALSVQTFPRLDAASTIDFCN